MLTGGPSPSPALPTPPATHTPAGNASFSWPSFASPHQGLLLFFTLSGYWRTSMCGGPSMEWLRTPVFPLPTLSSAILSLHMPLVVWSCPPPLFLRGQGLISIGSRAHPALCPPPWPGLFCCSLGRRLSALPLGTFPACPPPAPPDAPAVRPPLCLVRLSSLVLSHPSGAHRDRALWGVASPWCSCVPGPRKQGCLRAEGQG